MRIAFFSTLTNAPWGGSEVLWSKTAKYMASQGNSVLAFVKYWNNESEQITELKRADVEIQYVKSVEGRTLFSKIATKFQDIIFGEKKVFNALLLWNPDFIFFSQGHSYDLGYFSDKQLQTILNTSVPYALICQNNSDYNFVPETIVRERIKKIYIRATNIFFVSARNKRSAEKIVCCELENACLVSNSFSLSAINIIPFPSTLTTIQFACVARLRCSHKGQNLLFDILSQPKWLVRDWVLNLYGSGEDEFYLKELAGYLGISNKVIFHGHTNKVIDIWVKNHILLLASFGEGIPLALQEAMLCGRTAVVTDVGGNAELIEEGSTGWLAEGTTFFAFDKALERAWTNKKDWEQLGKNAFKKAIELIDLTPEITLGKQVSSIVLLK